MNDLADDWHWVVLSPAEEVEPKVFLAGTVRTACGIPISDTPRRVRLFDMGAPDAPTCPRCLDGGLSPGLRAQVEAAIEAGEAVPETAPTAPGARGATG